MEIVELIEKLNSDVLTLFEKKHFFHNIDLNAVKAGWLGFPPASHQAISKKEFELQAELPKSYRDFFLVSNGFRHISPFLEELSSIEKVNWAKNNADDQWWLDLVESDPVEMSDAEYLTYGEGQRTEFFRPEYFRGSLRISNWSDSCALFLNPNITHDGEWEVLFYANWYPGATRHRSFKEYLVNVHSTNLRFLKND